MTHFIYILYSVSLDLYYIGSSANPEERLKKHLANHRGFTSKAKDWLICYTASFSDKTEALKRERQLKVGKTGRKSCSLFKIKNRICCPLSKKEPLAQLVRASRFISGGSQDRALQGPQHLKKRNMVPLFY